jgi:hypothetical protein
MSNSIDYKLEVLASSPTEINQIGQRMKEPSTRFLNRWARRFGEPVSEVRGELNGLFKFETTKNLGYVDPSVNRARQFNLSFKEKHRGIVDSHLFEISAEFHSAIFLLTYRDMQASYSGNKVIRAGEVVQHMRDGDQKVQALDWVLLDIFQPFRAEYYDGLAFGSLWQEWLLKLKAAVGELKDQSSTAGEVGRQMRSHHYAEGASIGGFCHRVDLNPPFWVMSATINRI